MCFHSSLNNKTLVSRIFVAQVPVFVMALFTPSLHYMFTHNSGLKQGVLYVINPGIKDTYAKGLFRAPFWISRCSTKPRTYRASVDTSYAALRNYWCIYQIKKIRLKSWVNFAYYVRFLLSLLNIILTHLKYEIKHSIIPPICIATASFPPTWRPTCQRA